DQVQPDDNDPSRLAEEFYKGTYTRYRHIVANLDVIRPDKIDRIASAFAFRNIVVVHGASGQGKTSLAYRYLHDHAVGRWCFQVHRLDDDGHALRVARALADHARALGVRLLVYLDIAPRNLHWRWLVSALAELSTIEVLVTVREEDWARAK